MATYVQRHICSASSDKLADALRRLAAIAPKAEKRKVRLWRQEGDHVCILWQRDMNWKPNGSETRAWTIVGEAEIDA